METTAVALDGEMSSHAEKKKKKLNSHSIDRPLLYIRTYVCSDGGLRELELRS